MKYVTLKAIRKHENEFGDKFAKAVGDEYDAPENAAQSLIANELCEKVAASKAA